MGESGSKLEDSVCPKATCFEERGEFKRGGNTAKTDMKCEQREFSEQSFCLG